MAGAALSLINIRKKQHQRRAIKSKHDLALFVLAASKT